MKRPQKEKELLLFQKLVEIKNLNPNKVSQPEPPAPDIIAALNDKVVGIEISEIYSDNNRKKGSIRAKNQSAREKVLELAVALIKQDIHFPFNLSVNFNYNKISDAEMKSLPQIISQIVTEKLINVVPTDATEIIEYTNQNYKLNLDHISIYVNKNLETVHYSPVSADWVPKLTVSHLETVVQKKESKVETYNKYCDEIWLLIVELGGIVSAFADVSEAITHSIETKFDRLILLRSMENKAFEINTCG